MKEISARAGVETLVIAIIVILTSSVLWRQN